MLVIILLLIAAGAAAYFLTKDNNKNSNSTATPAANTSGANSFAPVSTAGQPYVATISTSSGGQQSTATMSTDGQGNTSYVVTKDGKETKIIYTADAYYLCSGDDTCIKYPSSQAGSSGFDPSAYQYDSSKINSLKSSAAHKGKQSCPVGGGTCDVWSVSSGGVTSTVYVNTGSQRIVKATTASGATTSDITYEYKNVTVVIPTNAVTVPTHQ